MQKPRNEAPLPAAARDAGKPVPSVWLSCARLSPHKELGWAVGRGGGAARHNIFKGAGRKDGRKEGQYGLPKGDRGVPRPCLDRRPMADQ